MKHITNIPIEFEPTWTCAQYGSSCAAKPEYATARDPLLVERQKTHGDFGLNAAVSQSLKRVFNDYKYRGMKVEHTEALDMIALKLSRILSGQANYKDHWDDIAGYAKLASEACEQKDVLAPVSAQASLPYSQA